MACVEDLCSFYLTLHFLKCLIALQAFCGGGEVVGWALTLQIQCFLRKICTALHRMTENAGCSRLFLSCPDLISSSRNRSILKPSEKYVTQCCNQGGPSLCHAQRRAWCFSPAWKCASEHRVSPTLHSFNWWCSVANDVAPAKDQPFCVLAVRKPMREILWVLERRGQHVWEPLSFAGFLWYSHTFARMYSKHLVLLLVTCTVVC